MNLLSIAAAYGVVVAIFQWGWARQLVGIDETVPINPFVPMMMFAILFGLSMDYEVFLPSRIREEHQRTSDGHASVVTGLAATTRVITSAALIMIAVLGGFVANPVVFVKMIGIGPAVAVLDATVIRLVLVPATMALLGRANWWLPRWLDRLLPHLNIDTEPRVCGSPAHRPMRRSTTPRPRRSRCDEEGGDDPAREHGAGRSRGAGYVRAKVETSPGPAACGSVRRDGEVVVMPAISPIFPGINIIDTDTHWSEPHDLWTSRAPTKYKDLVPQLREVKGRRKWVVNGNIPLAGDSAASAILPDGEKMLGLQFLKHDVDMVHAASYDCDARLELMDLMGVSHGIVYPNVGGFGNQNFLKVDDAALRIACVEIYNDAMNEIQQRSGGRILPMALVPWWDIDACVAEVDRMHRNGAKGIVMCSNPHDSGMPNFAQPDWRPFWEVCEALEMPINFHIGASEGDVDWSGSVPYNTWSGDVKLSLGGAAIFLGQLRWMVNLLVSDVPERYPNLKFVSVESGVGWIPFLLDALDYQCGETAPEHLAHLSMKPSEYFRRQFYGCFWFESRTLGPAIEHLGAERIMFETDIPHPTCLYPHSVERVRDAIAALDPAVQRRILQDNAAELYKIDVTA